MTVQSLESLSDHPSVENFRAEHDNQITKPQK